MITPVSHSDEIPIPVPSDSWTLEDKTEKSDNPEQSPSSFSSEFECTLSGNTGRVK